MRRLTALVLTVAVLVACAGDDDDDVTPTTATTPSSTTTTTAPPTTTTGLATTSTTEDLSGEGIGDLEVALADLLVQPDELGDPSFVDAGYTPEEVPATCGVDVDGEHPADARVGVRLQSDDLNVTIDQELRAYASLEEAAAAMAATRDKYSCGDGPDDINYLPPQDVTAEVGGDEAMSIQYAVGQQTEGLLIVARVTDVIATFAFAGSPTGGPDPSEVAAFGVGKLLALLEQG